MRREIESEGAKVARDAIFRATEHMSLRPGMAGMVFRDAARRAAAVDDIELSRALLQLAIPIFNRASLMDSFDVARWTEEARKDGGAMFPEEKRALDKTRVHHILNFKRGQRSLKESVGLELLLRPDPEAEQEMKEYVDAARSFVASSKAMYPK